jgi:flagellar M-ring protein FliF
MKDNVTRALARYRRTFGDFTVGQKMVSLVGTGALVLAAFLVFSWASAPSYTPLFSDLSPGDAASIIEQLDTSGVPYELTDGGATVMVPRDEVYKLRIDLSAEGLPGTSSDGYSILDDQGLSTSEFQEQTGFKRAMEGELSATIEALDDVDTAVVHLALPEREVFADEQQPPTASVLVSSRAGTTLEPQQVQAVVHLVASSVDGMDPESVTVADSSGQVLSSPDGVSGADGTARDQQVEAVQQELHARLQAMLDRVVGPGNSTVQVTASLDFDTSVTETTDYRADPDAPPLSMSRSSETYSGPAGGTGAEGVVGPDGNFGGTTGEGAGESAYESVQETQDNAIDTVVERRETAPGAIENLHVGVALDATNTQGYPPREIRGLVADTIGIDPDRGDTVRVSSMPFDRSVEERAAEELAAAQAADEAAAQGDLYRKVGIGIALALMVALALLKGRRRDRAREQATSYVVEQLRQESTARAAIEPPPAALAALAEAEQSEDEALRAELGDLIERQPEDVAALLRGWLTERG